MIPSTIRAADDVAAPTPTRIPVADLDPDTLVGIAPCDDGSEGWVVLQYVEEVDPSDMVVICPVGDEHGQIVYLDILDAAEVLKTGKVWKHDMGEGEPDAFDPETRASNAAVMREIDEDAAAAALRDSARLAARLSAVVVPLRWAALCGLLGHEIAKDLVPEAAVKAIPGLVASARNWLLTEAQISAPLRQAVEHAPADLELVAAALSITVSHGRGWDAMAACRDLGITQGQAPQPGGLTPLQELLIESIEDHSRTLAVYAAALRSRDAERIAAVEVRVADTAAHMNRCADALRAG